MDCTATIVVFLARLSEITVLQVIISKPSCYGWIIGPWRFLEPRGLGKNHNIVVHEFLSLNSNIIPSILPVDFDS